MFITHGRGSDSGIPGCAADAGGKAWVSFDLPSDYDDEALHLHLQIARDSAFADIVIDWETRAGEDGVEGWYLFTGTEWEAFPTDGAGTPFYGARVAFFYADTRLPPGTARYARYRVWDGANYSDWQGCVQT